MNYIYVLDHGNKYLKPFLGPNPEGKTDSDAYLDEMDVDMLQYQDNVMADAARNAIRFIPVGLNVSETPPTSFNNDLLRYKGKYYTVSDKRIPFLKDKTIDERYFILSLIAIAKKHLHEFPHYDEDSVIPITLLIGLPPDHFMELYDKYEQYFLAHGRECDFLFNDCQFSIKITEVHTYIQAHAAVAPIISDVKRIPRSLVIDMGGYTVDLLALASGAPNTDICTSLEDFGTIQFYTRVKVRFVNNICANATGYLKLYQAELLAGR